MAEVEMGKLAQQNAMSADVKSFGAMMVEDHSKANKQLMDIAANKHLALPDSLNNEEKAIMADLQKKSGADFDKAYVKVMVDDHQKDIKDFEEAGNVVKYPEMKAFIDKTLPVLKKHLAEIEKINGAMK